MKLDDKEITRLEILCKFKMKLALTLSNQSSDTSALEDLSRNIWLCNCILLQEDDGNRSRSKSLWFASHRQSPCFHDQFYWKLSMAHSQHMSTTVISTSQLILLPQRQSTRVLQAWLWQLMTVHYSNTFDGLDLVQTGLPFIRLCQQSSFDTHYFFFPFRNHFHVMILKLSSKMATPESTNPTLGSQIHPRAQNA